VLRLLPTNVPLHKLVSSTTEKFILDCFAPELEGSTTPCNVWNCQRQCHIQKTGTLMITCYRHFRIQVTLVWFDLFVHSFSHTCNIGHINYRLQFLYYNTTYNIWTSTQYSIINNNTNLKLNWKWNLSLHLEICVFV